MSSGEWLSCWWTSIRGRFDRINGTLAVLGLVTGLLSLASARLGKDSPVLEDFLWWIGVVIFSLSLLYCIVQVILAYPRYLNAQQLVGRKLTLTAIKALPPECVKVALVGLGAVGKTTLLHHLVAMEGGKPAQTTEPELTVFHVAAPVGLLAYLDAAGQDLPQQFEIIDHSDFLVLLLDHRAVSRLL